jgi:hypothetical protein
MKSSDGCAVSSSLRFVERKTPALQSAGVFEL